jgi:hypothetical protein
MLRLPVALLLLLTGFMATPSPDLPAWIKGCWELRKGSSVVEEQWLPPRGGIMLGVSRSVRDGRLGDYEFMLIRSDSGGLVYEAHQSGQPSASFRAGSSASSSEVVFENPAHDYPQRIGYRRESSDRLLAWIDGADRGVPRRVEFRYQRASCGD